MILPRIRKTAFLVLALFLSSLLLPAGASSLSPPQVTITPPVIGQGEVSLIEVSGQAREPWITWLGERIPMLYNKVTGSWLGFIGADLTTDPGEYKLQIAYATAYKPVVHTIRVRLKDYGVRRMTLPREMVELDAPTLERVLREIETVKGIFSTSSDDPLWRGSWARPVHGSIVSPFGCRNIINGVERSPHSGVDLKAPTGTPVRASNRGIVALVADHFFSGKSIFIDHGGGSFSMYFHLSHVSVRAGELVEKGDGIGLSGSSGRVTGPHLHFGIRLNGTRINPLRLIEISQTLE